MRSRVELRRNVYIKISTLFKVEFTTKVLAANVNAVNPTEEVVLTFICMFVEISYLSVIIAATVTLTYTV